MHFDWQKVPLIYNSFSNFRFPLTGIPPTKCEIYYGDRHAPLEEIAAKLGKDFNPPRGWKGYIEKTGALK